MSQKAALPSRGGQNGCKEREGKETIPGLADEHRRHSFARQLGIFATIAAIIIWIYWSYHEAALQQLSHNSASTPMVYHLPGPKIHRDGCPSVVASMARHFEYNITTNTSAAPQWHFQESTPPEAYKNFRGMVEVIRGDTFQVSDVEVRVIVKSDDESDIDNVLFDSRESALNVDYAFVGQRDACTHIQVLIFLRPWPRRSLDVFELRTELLDITFNEFLNWEVTSLIAHTSQGTLFYQNRQSNEPLDTFNVSISSSSGDIFGWFPANGNLEVQNDSGNVDFRLVHYDEHFNLESITVYTMTGDIYIETVFQNWPPRPLNHVTIIASLTGDIEAILPHGSMTRLGTEGSIIASVKTFGTRRPYEPNDFATVTREGINHVYLASPDEESLDGYYNPLLNMTSHHTASFSNLVLRYPDTWYGGVDAGINTGSLYFSASELVELERGKGYVKAKRGDHGESRLNAWVEEGDIDIRIGLP